MPESEWNACEKLSKMAEFVDGREWDTARRWRLFTVACCDRLWSLIYEKDFENLVNVLDRYADGDATADEWRAALREHYTHEFHSADAAEEGMGYREDQAAEFALMIAEVLASRCPHAEREQERRTPQAEEANQAGLLRDVFNPFRSATLNPSWLTPTVTSLADTIYQERAFDHLPILADALEEASCTNADILNHCRQPGEHVRGCWVIDLLTGRQ